MSIFSKIITAVRGGASEAGEAIVESQGIRIFEQEIRDAEKEIRTATSSLTDVMANFQTAKDEAATLQSQYDGYEAQAMEQMEKGNETLAAQVVERMTEIEADLAEKNDLVSQLEGQVNSLKALVKKNNKQLDKAKRSIATVKAQASINKATGSLSSAAGGTQSKLGDMSTTLEKLKAKQKHESNKNAAAQQLADDASGATLDAQLAKASAPSVEDKMAALKAKMAAKKA